MSPTDMGALTGVQPVLLFFLLRMDLLLAHVAPPTNVTLHCHNLQNILEWDYDRMEPGLRFRIDIFSDYRLHNCPSEVWVDQPPLQANLSYLSNPNAEYYIKVTAVNGQNESVTSPPAEIVFSYFLSSLVNQKCSLDLPSVTITPQPNDHILLSFDHPWLLYRNKLFTCESQKKKRRRMEPLPVFKYNVIVGQREQHHIFECEDSVCEQKLRVHGAPEKRCLQIDGELEKMQVKSTHAFCPPTTNPPSPVDHTAIFIGVGVVILLAAALVGFMVFHKKTRATSTLPSSIMSKPPRSQPTMLVAPDMVCITEEPSSPLPLLTNIEEEDTEGFIQTMNGSTEHDLRLPLGIASENQGDLREGGLNDEPAYMKGNELEEEEEEENPHSPYERREEVVVELAPGERTEGYRG